MARDDPPFKIRMPAEMRDQIAAAAKANNRSMNSEVVARLAQTFRSDSGLLIRIANLEHVVDGLQRALASASASDEKGPS